ncbi:hypothetical protein Pla100_36840 [Neorhodopirellula pilleata]|uniref:Uncharacterized protein n=1 Tax=Neorhodopirellula pilleata TaxID=2714738 RepID=A0A5C6A555_9BACT|nr:hypothetical protein Pla100_36840 [Neorhodopirellula pilleata]
MQRTAGGVWTELQAEFEVSPYPGMSLPHQNLATMAVPLLGGTIEVYYVMHHKRRSELTDARAKASKSLERYFASTFMSQYREPPVR